MRFDNYVKRLLIEANPTDIPDPAGDMGGMPQEDPTPEVPEAPQYDKPYQDLARVLYGALRLNFEDIPETYQSRILRLAADGAESISTDEEGVAFFQEVENILDEQEGVKSYKEL